MHVNEMALTHIKQYFRKVVFTTSIGLPGCTRGVFNKGWLDLTHAHEQNTCRFVGAKTWMCFFKVHFESICHRKELEVIGN